MMKCACMYLKKGSERKRSMSHVDGDVMVSKEMTACES
jgi:hypothetical protein